MLQLYALVVDSRPILRYASLSLILLIHRMLNMKGHGLDRAEFSFLTATRMICIGKMGWASLSDQVFSPNVPTSSLLWPREDRSRLILAVSFLIDFSCFSSSVEISPANSRVLDKRPPRLATIVAVWIVHTRSTKRGYAALFPLVL